MKPTKPTVLPAKKPTRQRGRLDKLPAHVQAEILNRATAGETWAEIRAWLRAERRCRINSDSVISQWYSRRSLQQQIQAQLEQHASQVDSMVDFMRRELPQLDQEKLERFAQNAFSVMALKNADPKVWVQIYRLQLQARELEIDREKLEILKHKAEQADKAKEIVTSKLSPDEKQKAMRAIFGLPT